MKRERERNCEAYEGENEKMQTLVCLHRAPLLLYWNRFETMKKLSTAFSNIAIQLIKKN